MVWGWLKNMRKSKLILLVLIACLSPPSFVSAEDGIVRAKFGIKIITGGNIDSGRKVGSLNNILSTNESLRVHVASESDAYVYIVNYNKNGAELLNGNPNDPLVKKGIIRFFPTPNQSYKPDGKNEEFISVIISAKERTGINTLFTSGPVSYEKWKQVEKRFFSNRPSLTPNTSNDPMGTGASVAKVERPDQSSNTIALGGSVRNMDSKNKTRSSSGKDWIIKKYKFTIKK